MWSQAVVHKCMLALSLCAPSPAKPEYRDACESFEIDDRSSHHTLRRRK